MTLGEANQIATLLGVSVTEVIRQAGIAVADDVQGVKLLGTVDAKSTVKPVSAGNVKLLTAPVDVPHDGHVLQIRSPQSLMDGWLLYVGAKAEEPELMVDRMCVIDLPEKKRVAGVLRRGYEPDTFTILPLLHPEAAMEDQTVDTASPILWIRPQ